jgi:hypothetical protein
LKFESENPGERGRAFVERINSALEYNELSVDDHFRLKMRSHSMDGRASVLQIVDKMERQPVGVAA